MFKVNGRVIWLVLFLFLSIGLVSCGSGGGDDGGGDDGGGDDGGSDDGGSDGGSTVGILLSGDAGTLASNAVSDYDSGDRTTDDEISTDANGARIDRTNIEIAFTDQATIDEINALLTSINAAITSMLEGVNLLVVQIPDPGTLDALDTIIAQVEADPVVLYVNKAYMPEPAALPSNYSFGLSNMDKIDHNLAVRAHAAWNAKAALKDPFNDPPLLIIYDFFGDGDVNSDFDVNSDPTDFESSKPKTHGYRVLSIISAKHGGGSSNRGLVTGIYPGTLDLKVVDVQQTGAELNSATGDNHLIMEIKKSNKNVLVNTSLSNINCTTKSCAEPLARSWITRLRGSALYATGKSGLASLENKFLHITAAGNIYSPTDPPNAEFVSDYNAARLLTGLKTSGGVNLDNLNNTLVIENRENSVAQPYSADCLATDSKYPGDLSAVGTNVWSFTSNNSGADDRRSGTSLASPQVAGLAAYVWAIASGLSPQELSTLLTVTARNNAPTVCFGGAAPRPIIDAYNAVLAIDKKSVFSGATLDEAPVRLAILDIVGSDMDILGGNDAFDEKDLERFLSELHTFTPPRIDYSRFDLNGDGYTGGDQSQHRTDFNLDIDYPPTHGNVTQNIGGTEVTFNENALTDIQVLCYYAYSPFYTGDTDQRTQLFDLFGAKCSSGRIAYIGDTGYANSRKELYSMNSDGTDDRRITYVPDDVAEFVWSPDGQKFAIAAGKAIYIVNADGTQLVDLSALSGRADSESDLSPTWAPDSQRIAFAGNRYPPDWEIYTVNIDGTGLKNITNNMGGACTTHDQSPLWASTGEKISFQKRVDCASSGENLLYTINSDGTGLTLLTADTGNYPYTIMYYAGGKHTDWSPDGQSIAYSKGFNEYNVVDGAPTTLTVFYANICINTNGVESCLTNVADYAAAYYPRWSPDGLKIAYVFSGDTQAPIRDTEIHVLDVTASTEITVASGHNGSTGLSWSPDGTRLIYSVPVGSAYGYHVFTVNADGTGTESDITPNAYHVNKRWPAWRPSP